jgi:hypothetical protein
VADPTVAIPVALDVQVDFAVTSLVDPSEKVPIAVKEVGIATAAVEGLGLIAIDVTIAEVTLTVAAPLIPPDVAITCVEPTATA